MCLRLPLWDKGFINNVFFSLDCRYLHEFRNESVKRFLGFNKTSLVVITFGLNSNSVFFCSKFKIMRFLIWKCSTYCCIANVKDIKIGFNFSPNSWFVCKAHLQLLLYIRIGNIRFDTDPGYTVTCPFNFNTISTVIVMLPWEKLPRLRKYKWNFWLLIVSTHKCSMVISVQPILLYFYSRFIRHLHYCKFLLSTFKHVTQCNKEVSFRSFYSSVT